MVEMAVSKTSNDSPRERQPLVGLNRVRVSPTPHCDQDLRKV